MLKKIAVGTILAAGLTLGAAAPAVLSALTAADGAGVNAVGNWPDPMRTAEAVGNWPDPMLVALRVGNWPDPM